MIEKFKAIWKRLLSYTKKNWDIDDYPLRFKKQSDITKQYNVGELKPWAVQIINWWPMTALGDTKQEAFENLKINFKSYLEQNIAPRPGTSVPIKYANTSQINELEEIASDFFNKILHMNFYNCFISDESSLLDFGKDDNDTLNKINETYKIGLAEIGDGNIARILKMINERKLIT
jgi:hypothetical protein